MGVFPEKGVYIFADVYFWPCIYLRMYFFGPVCWVSTICIFRKAIYTPPPPHANLNVHPHLLVLISPPPNLVSCSNLSSRDHLSLPGDFSFFVSLYLFAMAHLTLIRILILQIGIFNAVIKDTPNENGGEAAVFTEGQCVLFFSAYHALKILLRIFF